MTPVETVARALCIANDIDPDAPQIVGDCDSGKFWQFHESEARAAIEALPVTDRMIVAAYNELHDDFTAIQVKMLRRAIAAALRAALSEGKV